MLANFYTPRLSNTIKIAIQKNNSVGQILYRSLVLSKKRRQTHKKRFFQIPISDDPSILLDEFFSTARRENADLVILTGNLFSNSSPNTAVMHDACRKMRVNVYKPTKQIGFKCLQAPNKPNWHEKNINVQMPVLSLFGSKDRPVVSADFSTSGKLIFLILKFSGFSKLRKNSEEILEIFCGKFQTLNDQSNVRFFRLIDY